MTVMISSQRASRQSTVPEPGGSLPATAIKTLQTNRLNYIVPATQKNLSRCNHFCSDIVREPFMIIIEIVFVMRNTVSQLSVGNFHSFVRKVLESAISLETVNILLSTFSCQHQEMRQSAKYYLK